VYTVEFESDASVVVTIDHAKVYEDVEMVYAENGTVYIRQYDELMDEYQLIFMSHQQWQDLISGYRSPEGSFYLTEKRKGNKDVNRG